MIDDLDSVTSLYRMWLEASERCLIVAKGFTDKGYAISGLDAFEKAVVEARWVCQSAIIEGEIQPYHESLERLTPDNPDPARYGD